MFQLKLSFINLQWHHMVQTVIFHMNLHEVDSSINFNDSFVHEQHKQSKFHPA